VPDWRQLVNGLRNDCKQLIDLVQVDEYLVTTILNVDTSQWWESPSEYAVRMCIQSNRPMGNARVTRERPRMTSFEALPLDVEVLPHINATVKPWVMLCIMPAV
jgi:hypothetical protein